MKHPVYKKINLVCVVAIVVVGAMSWQSYALRKPAAAAPAVLVSVDISRVLLSLEERAWAEANAQAMIDKIEVDIETRLRHIEDYSEEFELYQTGSDKWKELKREQQQELFEHLALIDYKGLTITRLESRGMRSVYTHIRESIATLSEQNGWDYVFVNETVIELPEGDMVDMFALISSLRMLYANPEMDVTDTLIEYMNASFDEMAVR
jgi:Skp family chaperone for outer membrane proteins